MPAKPKDDGDRISALFYAPPDAGKTWLMGTAALDERTAPILILDFEGGLKTLQGLPGRGTDWIPHRCRSWDDFNEAFERARVNDEGFRSTGLDSLSEVHNFAIENILAVMADKRKEENADMVEQGDYGKALIQLRRLVREFRDLPMHFFCTAHAKDYTHPKEGLINVPNLYGKGAFEIPGLLETVGYLAEVYDEAGMHRELLLKGYAKLRTKARTPWGREAPDEIVDPTITKLLDALGYAF